MLNSSDQAEGVMQEALQRQMDELAAQKDKQGGQNLSASYKGAKTKQAVSPATTLSVPDSRRSAGRVMGTLAKSWPGACPDPISWGSTCHLGVSSITSRMTGATALLMHAQAQAWLSDAS